MTSKNSLAKAIELAEKILAADNRRKAENFNKDEDIASQRFFGRDGTFYMFLASNEGMEPVDGWATILAVQIAIKDGEVKYTIDQGDEVSLRCFENQSESKAIRALEYILESFKQ